MDILYNLVLLFIDCYKFLEYGILRCFHPITKKLGNKLMAKYGVNINGKNSWDMQVLDESVYTRALNRGNLGLGESYMDGEWECDNLAEFFRRIFAGEDNLVKIYMHPWNRFLNYMECSHFNLQTRKRSFNVAKIHYDLGNDLFSAMLDPTMNYSCGYWKNASTLEEAQIAKMELIASKLNLKPGMTVLDIGCGWGGMAKHLAKNYGVSVTGLTISKEQAAFATKSCAGLSVKIDLVDYRDVKGTYDRVISVGSFEHFGRVNYRGFFEIVHRVLKDDGIFLLHTIGYNHWEMPGSEPWLTKYIFPGGYIPNTKQIVGTTEKLFIVEDWQNFGHDYSKTLNAWRENFLKAWPRLRVEKKYDDRFYRMWNFYLELCKGGFQARKVQLWQIVMSKNGIAGGYYGGR
ncbi:cyclopropane-fatty-acyl-phospholipid synthase [Folsomia candida]|uniref:Cyclopropane-fatty-acyl-phospholipid synthase n=1 Tax=Folsomia candida TaxID=158441 RepID=A0A226F3H9_FOLCA|nr:cyclopropane-fatty-acyl-phospholipid synthase [Folsomia candida]OXA64329.1 Cyclopropane-fatty-acyl-phospholipid synthase [Folsomia candida]